MRTSTFLQREQLPGWEPKPERPEDRRARRVFIAVATGVSLLAFIAYLIVIGVISV